MQVSTLTAAGPQIQAPLPDLDELSFAAYLLDSAPQTVTFVRVSDDMLAQSGSLPEGTPITRVARRVWGSSITWWTVLIIGPLIAIAIAAFVIRRSPLTNQNPAGETSISASQAIVADAPSPAALPG